MSFVFRKLLSLPVAFALLFIAIPPLLFYWHPFSFWVASDYEPLGLADALNMAYRLADLKVYPARGLMDHPGVPFYFMSWLALAFTGYPIASAGSDFLSSVLAHAERYHQITIWLAAVAGGIGVYIYGYTARNLAPTSVIALGLAAWLVSTPATLLMFMSPSIDSFAILLNGLFFLTLVRLAYDDEINPFIMVLAGCVGASAYLTKLPYIYIPLALLAAIVVRLVFRRTGSVRGILLFAFFVASFFAAVAAVGYTVIGWYGFGVLREFHRQVIMGSGTYGAGAQNVVSAEEVWNALAMIPTDKAYATLIAIAVGICLIVGGFVARLKGEQYASAGIMSIGAGIASVLSAVIVLKHYDLHYTAGVSATLPACAVAAYLLVRPWADRFRKIWIPLATIAVLRMGWLIMPGVVSSQAYYSAQSELVKADSADIRAFLTEAKGTVDFVYRTQFPEYGAGFLITYASVPRLTDAYLKNRSNTVSSMVSGLINQDDIGAYVLDKRYFPTVGDIKAATNIALLGPQPVTFRDGDRLIELRTAFILIRH